MKKKKSTSPKPDLLELKKFGLMVGSIFLILAFFKFKIVITYPVALMLISGLALISMGLLIPRFLKWPYHYWMKAGHALGFINAQIILSVIFIFLITPIAYLNRFFKGDFMSMKIDPSLSTYRVKPGENENVNFDLLF